MNKYNYRIVLNGEICPGAKIETVKERMADLFKLSVDQVNRLFSGKRQVVKKNIDRESAGRYQEAIENTGAVCRVEIEEVDTSGISLKEDKSKEAKEPESLPVCPKCGYEAQSDSDSLIIAHGGLGECPACGIIVSKYLAENPPAAEEKLDKEEADPVPTFYSDEHIID